MLITRRFVIGGLALSILAGTCLGEDPAPAPPKFYRLDFVIKETDGTKVLNSRAFSTLASTRNKTEIRAGSKIPYMTSTTQYNQLDVGVNIDVLDIKEMQDRLSANILVEVTSLPAAPPDPLRPPIRQNKWSSSLIIPLKKTTLLFSSDNLDSKSQMQVEVTAIPIP
jgi:hypothetical protein